MPFPCWKAPPAFPHQTFGAITRHGCSCWNVPGAIPGSKLPSQGNCLYQICRSKNAGKKNCRIDMTYKWTARDTESRSSFVLFPPASSLLIRCLCVSTFRYYIAPQGYNTHFLPFGHVALLETILNVLLTRMYAILGVWRKLMSSWMTAADCCVFVSWIHTPHDKHIPQIEQEYYLPNQTLVRGSIVLVISRFRGLSLRFWSCLCLVWMLFGWVSTLREWIAPGYSQRYLWQQRWLTQI